MTAADQIAAIEAASKAIFDIRDDAYDMDEWDDLDATDREPFECQARAALEAAHPALLATIREQAAKLEAVREACDQVITNADGHKPPGPPHPTREQATAMRIRAALGAGDE